MTERHDRIAGPDIDLLRGVVEIAERHGRLLEIDAGESPLEQVARGTEIVACQRHLRQDAPQIGLPADRGARRDAQALPGSRVGLGKIACEQLRRSEIGEDARLQKVALERAGGLERLFELVLGLFVPAHLLERGAAIVVRGERERRVRRIGLVRLAVVA